MPESEIKQHAQRLSQLSAPMRLKEICQLFKKVGFATSFGKEDQIITHWIAELELPIESFTLDTGRLFNQTYQTWQSTQQRYHINIQSFCPNEVELSRLVSEKGPNSFYESVESRQNCCNIRKINPLKNALKGFDCWIVGLRAEQSNNRKSMQVLQWDQQFGLAKLSPIIDFSQNQVDDLVNKHHIPTNPLHQQGFVSIGCEPCTRAIKEGEDFRSGRWWWEISNKECGLHQKN